jgi:hypothetical protein
VGGNKTPFNLGHSFSINLYPRDVFSCNNNKILLTFPLAPIEPKAKAIFQRNLITAPSGDKKLNELQAINESFSFPLFHAESSITYRFHLITTINKLVGLSHFLSIV